MIKEEPGQEENNYAFADGKLAWFPFDYHGRCGSVHVLNVATGHRSVTGPCGYGDLEPWQIAIAGKAILSLAGLGGNTESDEKVYSGRKLVASFQDTRCDSGVSCGTDLFATGGHAFVFHAGTLFQVAGSRLKSMLSSSGYHFAGASWPYVALAQTNESVYAPADVRVYRLTDGTRVRTIKGTFAGQGVVLSGSLLAAKDLTQTVDLPRRVARVYDLRSGHEVAVIQDEAVVAIVGRQMVTLAPPEGGPRFRLHSFVPLRRVLIRRIGEPPRVVGETGDYVLRTFVHGRTFYWIERPHSGSGFSLRSLGLARL